MMKRSAVLAGAVATFSLVHAPVRAATLTPVSVGAAITDGLTPILYGMRSDIFARHGLDITLQSASSGAALSAAVAGGSVDIANSSLMSVITANARGVKFAIVAGGSIYTGISPTSLLCALKTAPIRSWADLNGKTVATTALQALDQIGIMSLVDRAGGDSSTVKFIEVHSPEMLEALQQQRIDAASITTPALGVALASGLVQSIGDPYSGIAPRVLIAVWFGSREFVTQKPEVAAGFAAGLREAAAYTNSHHAETLPLLADYAHLDSDALRNMNRVTTAVDLVPQEIQPSIDAAAKYKVIAEAFPARMLLL